MRSYYLSTGLAERFTVDLAALIQPKLITPFFKSYETGLNEAKTHLEGVFRKVHFEEMKYSNSKASKILAFMSLFSLTPYSIAWHRSDSYQKLIQKLLKENEYDLIHVDTLGLYQFVKTLAKTPLILDHHNIESTMMLRRAQKINNIFLKAYFYIEAFKIRFYEKRVLNRFAHHITCSRDDSLLLNRINPKLSATEIPNPVARTEGNERGKINIYPPRALFIGGLDWYPNRDAIEHFLEDLAAPIFEKCSLLHVDIIGKNPSKRILNLTKDTQNIKIHGYVDRIDEFYEKSTIYVCPIRDGGGTKLKVIDAMMHKQAVIGYPEAFEGLGVIDGTHAIICTTPEEFISKFLFFVANESALNAIAENAFNYAINNFANDVIAKKLGDLYMSLAKPD